MTSKKLLSLLLILTTLFSLSLKTFALPTPDEETIKLTGDSGTFVLMLPTEDSENPSSKSVRRKVPVGVAYEFSNDHKRVTVKAINTSLYPSDVISLKVKIRTYDNDEIVRGNKAEDGSAFYPGFGITLTCSSTYIISHAEIDISGSYKGVSDSFHLDVTPSSKNT